MEERAKLKECLGVAVSNWECCSVGDDVKLPSYI